MSRTGIEKYLEKKALLESQDIFPANFRELLDRAAENYGDACAVNFFEQEASVTFTELRDRVYRLADGFQRQGIRKHSHVAVMVSNRIEYPITWLALATLGAVMIPVNVRYTGSELDYMINDSDSDFFILESQYLHRLQQMEERPEHLNDTRVIVINDEIESAYVDWFSLLDSGDFAFRPKCDLESGDLLNIQYTSGTTGFPKGCMQTQRYWILLGGVMGELNPGIKSVLSDHPFFYMDPQWQLVLGLYAGATVYYAARLSSSKYLERINRYGIEFAFFPRPLFNETGAPEDRNTPLKKLIAVAAGAENIARLQTRFGVIVRDVYGMTEIGPGLLVPDEVTDPEAMGSCGVPAPFRECRVVQDDGTDAAPGEVGELWIRGDGIFLGYYKKPEVNAEQFVDGWFRTGDLFIRDDRGFHRIVGRIKDMIRRSSENISALEVEQVLTSLPGVKQAAAVPVPDDYRGEEVKVYISLHEEHSPESLPPTTIIDHCREKLAAFKVPRYIAYVTEFPYTPTQKIAKHQLIAAVKDLRQEAWDGVENVWR